MLLCIIVGLSWCCTTIYPLRLSLGLSDKGGCRPAPNPLAHRFRFIISDIIPKSCRDFSFDSVLTNYYLRFPFIQSLNLVIFHALILVILPAPASSPIPLFLCLHTNLFDWLFLFFGPIFSPDYLYYSSTIDSDHSTLLSDDSFVQNLSSYLGVAFRQFSRSIILAFPGS